MSDISDTTMDELKEFYVLKDPESENNFYKDINDELVAEEGLFEVEIYTKEEAEAQKATDPDSFEIVPFIEAACSQFVNLKK